MALGSTIYAFDIELADADRGVYETLALRVAQHPSETPDYLVTRVLAYCLEHAEGIGFSKGLSDPGEPAIFVRDLTGALMAWIDIGLPEPSPASRQQGGAARRRIHAQGSGTVGGEAGRREDPSRRKARGVSARSCLARANRQPSRATHAVFTGAVGRRDLSDDGWRDLADSARAAARCDSLTTRLLVARRILSSIGVEVQRLTSRDRGDVRLHAPRLCLRGGRYTIGP